jgi:shikimate dehydrogenase
MQLIDKETQLCISLSEHPGNFGNYFHNYLFQQLGYNFLYKSFKTSNLKKAIESLKVLGIRGCAISMPFKSEVLKYIDIKDQAVLQIGSANTIVNEKGILKAYNTDSFSINRIMLEEKINLNSNILIKGSGGMARAIIFSLKNLGFNNINIVSRNKKTTLELIKKWDLNEILQSKLNSEKFDLAINATPLGMSQLSNETPFEESIIINSSLIMDVVVNPNGTMLSKICKKYRTRLITGEMITKLQAKKQFELYTGTELKKKMVDEAYNFYMLKIKS